MAVGKNGYRLYSNIFPRKFPIMGVLPFRFALHIRNHPTLYRALQSLASCVDLDRGVGKGLKKHGGLGYNQQGKNYKKGYIYWLSPINPNSSTLSIRHDNSFSLFDLHTVRRYSKKGKVEITETAINWTTEEFERRRTTPILYPTCSTKLRSSALS